MILVPCRSGRVGRFPRWSGYRVEAGENPHGLGPSTAWYAQGIELCFRCHRPGHFAAECPVVSARMNVTVPSVAPPYPTLMDCGGCLQEAPYGSGGRTSARAPPPQPSSSPSPDLENNGCCAPTFDEHLLTAQCEQQGKAANGSALGSGFVGGWW